MTSSDRASDIATFDVARVRALYPALRTDPARPGHRPAAYLDGAAGTQVPDSVIEAIAEAYRGGLGNVGGAFAASRRSDAIVEEARVAVGDLLGADPAGIAFGPSSTALTYRLANAMSQHWQQGDEVVLTRLDHDANVRPWVQAAARVGATVLWADPDLLTGDLPVEAVTSVISGRCRLVAVTGASNILGTRPDLAAIAAAAHEVGAHVHVDGVHVTPHSPVDVAAIGADTFVTSAYKWSGPHVAALAGTPAIMERLHPDQLASSATTVPHRFERGTLPFADLAGVTAAVNHLADLAFPPEGAESRPQARRERIVASMTAVEAYEQRLFAALLSGLGALPKLRLIGSPARRTATVYFTVDGHSPRGVAEHLDDVGVNVWNGHNYAWELTGALGIRDAGSAVRAGLVHYNDADDVARLLAGLSTL